MLSQLQFPGMPAPVPAPQQPAPFYHKHHDSYQQWGPNVQRVDNPLHDPAAAESEDWGERRNQWIPTEGLISSQENVDQTAVDHLAGSFDRHPSVLAIAAKDSSGKPQWSIGDGNHRANAAQQRGQLFMAARTRGDGPPTLGPRVDPDN
jgi:hypothetical protein